MKYYLLPLCLLLLLLFCFCGTKTEARRTNPRRKEDTLRRSESHWITRRPAVSNIHSRKLRRNVKVEISTEVEKLNRTMRTYSTKLPVSKLRNYLPAKLEDASNKESFLLPLIIQEMNEVNKYVEDILNETQISNAAIESTEMPSRMESEGTDDCDFLFYMAVILIAVVVFLLTVYLLVCHPQRSKSEMSDSLICHDNLIVDSLEMGTKIGPTIGSLEISDTFQEHVTVPAKHILVKESQANLEEIVPMQESGPVRDKQPEPVTSGSKSSLKHVIERNLESAYANKNLMPGLGRRREQSEVKKELYPSVRDDASKTAIAPDLKNLCTSGERHIDKMVIGNRWKDSFYSSHDISLARGKPYSSYLPYCPPFRTIINEEKMKDSEARPMGILCKKQ